MAAGLPGSETTSDRTDDTEVVCIPGAFGNVSLVGCFRTLKVKEISQLSPLRRYTGNVGSMSTCPCASGAVMAKLVPAQVWPPTPSGLSPPNTPRSGLLQGFSGSLIAGPLPPGLPAL